MKMLELFAGIGCASLAADMVWGGVEHSFVEINPFSQAILRKHFPNSPIHDDIKTYIHRGGAVDLVWGSPPCQSASTAGKRKGTSDPRWLWPETFGVLSASRPRWVVLENVRGILSLGGGVEFNALCSELETLGYEVWPFLIPACGVGAPHRRDRVWIVAHAIGGRWGAGGNGRKLEAIQGRGKNNSSQIEKSSCGNASYPNDVGPLGGGNEVNPAERNKAFPRSSERPCYGWNSDGYPNWAADWKEVALSTCVLPMDDGFTKRLFRFIMFAYEESKAITTPNGTEQTQPKEGSCADSSGKSTKQDLFSLWKILQQKEVWESFRGLWQIQDAEILYKTMCEISEEPEIQMEPNCEGSEKNEEKELRKMWEAGKASCPSSRWESSEQYDGERPDSLHLVSFQASWAITTAWHSVRTLPKPKRFYRLADGTLISAARLRTERLKALGNAIVWQVAREIFRAIRKADSIA